MHELTPSTRDEVRAILRRCSARTQRVLPRGHGTRSIRPIDREAQSLSLAGLDRIVDLDVEEQIITVEAGVPLVAISEALRETGLFLPPVLGCEAGTAGGLCSDPREAPTFPRLGRVRDHLLGIEAVRGDGTAFKAGGRVVKNVTGYDLTRLLCGARGYLGVLTLLHWRLLPRPAAIREARIDCDSPDTLWKLLRQIRAQPIEPLLVAIEPPHQLRVVVESGATDVCDHHLERITALIDPKRGRVVLADLPSDDITEPWQHPKTSSTLTVRVRAPFSSWREVVSCAKISKLLRWHRIYPCAHHAVGFIADGTPEQVQQLNRDLKIHGGSAALESLPRAWSDDVHRDGFAAHERSLADALDPHWDPAGVLSYRP